MALIKCPECGRDVSDKASNCPGCGYPFNRKRVGTKMLKNIFEIVGLLSIISGVVFKNYIIALSGVLGALLTFSVLYAVITAVKEN